MRSRLKHLAEELYQQLFRAQDGKEIFLFAGKVKIAYKFSENIYSCSNEDLL